jgi:ferrous iron transport protein B
MELPAYHAPTLVNTLRGTWERGWSFIKKAGTIILLASILVWFGKSFGFVDGSFGMVEDMDASLLAAVGSFVAPLFAPLGFGNWQSTVATVLGLVAKEEVVGVFGVLYGVSGNALELVEEGAFNELGPIAQHFTALSAYSFLIFNLLCAPCFAAIGAIKREMNNARWTWFAIGYQTVFAYTISLIVYQLGLLFTGGSFGVGTLAALILVVGYIWLLARKGQEGAEKSARSVQAVGAGAD